MKYGIVLREHSTPGWAIHNIAYDKIKFFIKEHTTHGEGKARAIPRANGDDKPPEFEDDLFEILSEQHEHITLFVKSKSGEIRHRIVHAQKQLDHLATTISRITAAGIPLRRLEKYSDIEADVIRAGKDIENLARFIQSQRTGFRKLLKKYRRWTGSTSLESRFRDRVLSDPKSFTKIDVGPMLDLYSVTRQNIVDQYERMMQQSREREDSVTDLRTPPGTVQGSASVRDIQDELDKGERAAFDTAMSTVPLGRNSTFASFWVHPDNVVELQILLLQHAHYYLTRSRSNSIAGPVTGPARRTMFTLPEPDWTDYHSVVAENRDRYVREQAALTEEERERRPGSFPQQARATARWNNQDEWASVGLRLKNGKTRTAELKQDLVYKFFNLEKRFSADSGAASEREADKIAKLRSQMQQDGVQPLYHFASCRSRLVGLDDGPDGIVLATLDTDIKFDRAGDVQIDTGAKSARKLPFALLQLRQDGNPKSKLLSILDTSHLAQRVRGFSIEYHCLYHTLKPAGLHPPHWNNRDVQDLLVPAPKAAPNRRARVDRNFKPLPRPKSKASASDTLLDSSESPVSSNLEHQVRETLNAHPPLSSFRRKLKLRKDSMRPTNEPISPTYRGWTEYENPEDGGDQEGMVWEYYPNDYFMIDRFFAWIRSLFGVIPQEERRGSADSTDSEDEPATASAQENQPLTREQNGGTFGTFGASADAEGLPASRAVAAKRENRAAFLLQMAVGAFTSAITLLILGYLMHFTGRKKAQGEVRGGVVFSIVCSLVFVVLGFMAVLKSGKGVFATWAASVVLVVVAVAAGGLIAASFG